MTGVLIRWGKRGFPVGPVAKTPYSQYMGLGSIPGATTKRPSILQLSQINIKKEKRGGKEKQGHRGTGRALWDDTGRDRSDGDVSTSQETPRIVRKPQKLGRIKEALPGASEGAWPHGHLHFRITTSRTVRN